MENVVFVFDRKVAFFFLSLRCNFPSPKKVTPKAFSPFVPPLLCLCDTLLISIIWCHI